jgi:hypothetical protein
VQYGIEEHQLFGTPDNAELLKLQQHCINLDREAWPATTETDSRRRVKIPHDLWVNIWTSSSGVFVTVPAGKRWL